MEESTGLIFIVSRSFVMIGQVLSSMMPFSANRLVSRLVPLGQIYVIIKEGLDQGNKVSASGFIIPGSEQNKLGTFTIDAYCCNEKSLTAADNTSLIVANNQLISYLRPIGQLLATVVLFLTISSKNISIPSKK